MLKFCFFICLRPLKYVRMPRCWCMEFEAVYQNAQVFVNGTLAAEQRYGYISFFVALEQYLKYGEENESVSRTASRHGEA